MKATTVRRLTPQMRQALVIALVILSVLGVDLAVFPAETDRFFSWPIQPLLTASTLAASYLTAVVVLLLAMRGRVWAPVKVVLPGGVIFSGLATLATFAHFGKFNFGSDVLSARIVAWIWLVAYLILPPLLVLFWPGQLRAPGSDPQAKRPADWLRLSVLAIGGALVVCGMILFAAPQAVLDGWAWPLTPLTARVLSAWFTGLGLVYGYAAWTNDRMRLRAPVTGLLAFGLLQGLALLRHGGDAGGAALAGWIVFLALCTGVGGVGLKSVWAEDPARLEASG